MKNLKSFIRLLKATIQGKIINSYLFKMIDYKPSIKRVKNENVEVKTQITSLIEENKGMQEKYKAMLEKMQTELRRKQLFIEELKNRVILIIYCKSKGIRALLIRIKPSCTIIELWVNVSSA